MSEKKKINWIRVLYFVGVFLAGGGAAVIADIHPSCSSLDGPPTSRPDDPEGSSSGAALDEGSGVDT